MPLNLKAYNKPVYWILLVAAIAIVTLASLRLFYKDPSAPGQAYSPKEATRIVSDYMLLAEFIYDRPPFEAYTNVQYYPDGDKWAGLYNGPSAWGENSTILWIMYEQGNAVQIVNGYANP